MPSRITSKREQRAVQTRQLRADGLSWSQVAARIRAAEHVSRRIAMRLARGWTQWEVARRWNDQWPADDGGPGITAQNISYWETWPVTGREPTLRTLLRLAQLYDCDVSDLIDFEQYAIPAPAPAAAAGLARPRRTTSDARVLPEVGGAPEADPDTRPAAAPVPPPAALSYGEEEEPAPAAVTAEYEVIMAAHEASEHAEGAERRDIGEATLEQFRADVMRLSRESMATPALALFGEMRRVRQRIYFALDRQLWPRDQADLYFLLAVLDCLMGVTADSGLGMPDAGEELMRAAWAYATAIDHRPLMAQLRLSLANVAYWNDRPRHGMQLAQSGLEYLADGPNGAQLCLHAGRAAARIGDAGTARQAITAAADARDRDHTDDVLELGGEFGFSRATQHYLAGSILTELPDAAADAVTELERAASLYEAGPEPGEDHSYRCQLATYVNLATSRVRTGQLDGAAAALEPILSLASDRRTRAVAQRLRVLRGDLATTRYRGSPEADRLDQRIEFYLAETGADQPSAL
jgi:hypothetical protein